MQENKVIRFFLRLIDCFVALYSGRGIRWNEEPFRVSSTAERRVGGCFMAVFPTLMLVGAAFGETALKWFDHHIVWLYVAVIGFISLGAFCMAVGAKKIPLSVSVPIAFLMWVSCLWYAWTHLI